MPIRVAINGFGRIGRQVLQAGLDEKGIEWVAIHDLTDTKTLAHLFKYDSVYGVFPGEVKAKEKSIVINGKEIQVFSEHDIKDLPWKKLKVDVVVESTGMFTTKEGAMQHIKAGAKKVLISAFCKDADVIIVKGVNEHLYDRKKHNIVSNASCTTNCLAPIVKVLNDNFGVERGYMLTIHAYTNDQRLVDAGHDDLRRARAAAVNLIPTTTGAARAVAEVIPELKGKIDGMAVRAPVPCGSLATFTAELKKPTDTKKVNWLFSEVSKYHLKGILQYSDEPIVSHDIIKNPYSCIFDSLCTEVIGGNFVSVTGWYDNEWGYSKRMIDVLKLLM
jgi:glyceraldehyde 3-phosphate dehydrogenase